MSRKSEMELSFPLVDTIGIPLTLDAGQLAGRLKKKVRLGFGATIPLDASVHGVVDRAKQRSTITGSMIDRLSFVLRHDDLASTEILWLYDATGTKGLTDEALTHDDAWFDHLFATKGDLVKFKRSPASQKWVRV